MLCKIKRKLLNIKFADIKHLRYAQMSVYVIGFLSNSNLLKMIRKLLNIKSADIKHLRFAQISLYLILC